MVEMKFGSWAGRIGFRGFDLEFLDKGINTADLDIIVQVGLAVVERCLLSACDPDH
jgi:hypothetical protein